MGSNQYTISSDGVSPWYNTGSLYRTRIAQDVRIEDGAGLIVGHTAQETISLDGSTDLVPEVQILGTAAADASLMLAAFSTTATIAGSPILAFVKSGDAAIDGTHVVVTDDEELGNIVAYGDDGTDLESIAAQIQFEVDGTPGTGDMPGRIVFATTADGAETTTERMRIDSSGVVTITSGGELHVVIAGSAITPSSATAAVFQRNSSTGQNAEISIISGNAGDAVLNFGDAEDENVGKIRYVNNGNSMEFFTNAASKMSISSAGLVAFAGVVSVDDTTDSTSPTTGSIHTDGGLGVAKGLFVNARSWIERSTSDTSTQGTVLNITANSTGNAADGFGPILNFQMGDTAVTSQRMGGVGFERNGADNTSRFTLLVEDSGSVNEAFRVSNTGVGSFDLAGSGTAAQTDLFDDYDDAVELRRYADSVSSYVSPEQRTANRQRMVEMGIIEAVPESSSGYHLLFQPITRLLAGGIYQSRARMDAQYEELDKRIQQLEAA